MANQSQLEILKRGPEAWNEWRRGAPNVAIDLRRADLSGADLSGADLSEAHLREANLGGANLGEANLGRADLRACPGITALCQ